MHNDDAPYHFPHLLFSEAEFAIGDTRFQVSYSLSSKEKTGQELRTPFHNEKD